MYLPTKIAVELSLAGHGRINWDLQVQVQVRRCRRCYQIESTVWLAGPWDGTVTLAVLYCSCSSMQASPGYCLVCSVAFYAIITVAPDTTTSNASEAARTRPGTYRYEYMAHVDGLDELVSMCEGVSCTRRRTAFLVIPHKPQPCQRQADVLGLAGTYHSNSVQVGYSP